MQTTIKIISTAIKLTGVVGYLTDYLPAATAVLVVAIASTLKDTLTSVGDLIDDGQRNNSFKP